MRKMVIAVLLLRAAAAFAQPAISAEVSSDPLPFQATPGGFAVPAIAMARDRIGVAIAWVMHEPNADDRISVGRLDATGHFTGSVHTIPVLSQLGPIEAITPSLAPATSGEGFTLAWLEVTPTNSRSGQVVYCRLDAALNASAPVALPSPPRAVSSPAIVRSRRTTWITGNGYAWQIRDDGSVNGPLDAGIAGSDMTVASDFPQIVSGQRITIDPRTCAPGGGCSRGFGGICTCSPFHPFYSMQFISLYTASSTKNFDFDTDATPAIGSNNSDVTVALFPGPQRTGGVVVTISMALSAFKDFASAADHWRTIGHVEPDLGYTRPDIASDDERYVVVWRIATPDGSHDVVGASIDRAGTIVPLSIATSSEDERDPSVVALGNGKFLVAYDKLSNGERRIAGRFVTFGGRTHAVR
jgi:hypothetical protein